MDKKAKAVVGVFVGEQKRHEGRVVRGEAKLIEKLETGSTVGELLNDPHWKTRLAERCQQYGTVLAVAVMRHDKQGCNVAVNIAPSEERPLERRAKKPVTRGGVPIGEPVTGKRTMATRRRKVAKRQG
jgi:hypothetical protein